MTGLPRLALGTAVLTAERLAGRTSANSPVAIAIGLVDQARARLASVTIKVKPPALKQKTLKQLVHDAGARGAIHMSRSRRDAETALREVFDGSVNWAERKFVPKVIEDMMPQLVNDVIPRVIDGVMPQIRAKVLPVLIDDLAKDPKVRSLITEQSQSVITDAADELRHTSADADDRVESTFRRLFRV